MGAWHAHYHTCMCRVKLLAVSVCHCRLSVGTKKNTSSPDSGHSISAKYIQTVQNSERQPCLCSTSTVFCVGIYRHAYQPHQIPYILSTPGPWPHVNVKRSCTQTMNNVHLQDNSFSVPRVHYTKRYHETTVVPVWWLHSFAVCM